MFVGAVAKHQAGHVQRLGRAHRKDGFFGRHGQREHVRRAAQAKRGVFRHRFMF